MRVVLIDRVVKLRYELLHQGEFLFSDSQFFLRFAKRFFLVGVRNGLAPLLGKLAAMEVGPRLHQSFLPFLDLRLPVTELVALEPVAHPAQLHVNPTERVARLLGEVGHYDLEVLERLSREDIG